MHPRRNSELFCDDKCAFILFSSFPKEAIGIIGVCNNNKKENQHYKQPIQPEKSKRKNKEWKKKKEEEPNTKNSNRSSTQLFMGN